ncbi:MAG: hypothetical protein V1798_00400 [Pseudomonadota bacterium]
MAIDVYFSALEEALWHTDNPVPMANMGLDLKTGRCLYANKALVTLIQGVARNHQVSGSPLEHDLGPYTIWCGINPNLPKGPYRSRPARKR